MTTHHSWAANLASALNATLVHNHGDVRIVLGRGDFIYCSPLGTVKLDHRGHIVTLGSCHAATSVLVAAFEAATSEAVA